MALYQVNEGEYTKTVYGLIKEQKFADVIGILSSELEKHPKSRPALSLLGYSYYQVQDFINAAECYAELTKLHPEVEEYKLYHAQALYKSFAFAEAMKASYLIENPDMQAKTTKLQAAIKYSEEDLPATKSLVEQIPDEDPDKEVNLACILYKEGQFEEACEKFTSALNVIGLEQDLWYNVALCNYKLCHYSDAIPCITAIYEKGIKDHPELSVGMITEFGSMEVRSVGNTKILEGTYLIEAFNLRAAIEYTLKKITSAMEALTDMPPRGEEELDPVTLHNQALIYMEQKPTEGFEKLQFLLQQNPFPPETFGNLLLLYCKYQYYDLAADVLAENSHLTYKFLNAYMFSYLDAVITQQTSVEEAFRKFDDLTVQYTENLRKLTKKIQETRQNHDEAGIKKAVKEYDDALERYVPVLMSQAKIYWDRENYPAVEKVFRKSVEFCQDNETWKLNVGHVLFMQENKYKEAIGFYEPVVKKYYDNILEVSAIVLANLCVSYIMTSANEEAEELMRKIEKEEEQVAYDEPDKKIYHLCIVNLVIGTLYCSKGNYEFGISRIIKSLEPYNKKLGTDTWYYAKRSFLSLIENMAKQMIMVRDSIIEEVLAFFDQCEIHGRDVLTVVEQPLEAEPMHAGKNSVTYEARILKHLFLMLS